MADVYVSSVSYAAVPQWAATTAYTVGQFVRALATPVFASNYVQRCTTAGTTAGSEPVWSTTNNGTTTSGTAVFTNVTGQSTYGWSAAAGTLYTFSNAGTASFNRAVGDRVFVASNHSETSSSTNYGFGSSGSQNFGSIQIISVSAAGSVPPVAADEVSGAAITGSGASLTIDALNMVYWQGFTITCSGNTGIQFNNTGNKSAYFKNCAFVLSGSSAATNMKANNPSKATWDSTTVQFGHVSQTIASPSFSFDLTWINTPSAIQGATIPTTLFNNASTSGSLNFTCRGVDLSAATGTLMTCTSGSVKGLLDSCRIASAVTRYATPAAAAPGGDEIELVNCYDGTNQLNERHTAAGSLTVDRTTTMSGGASDTIGAFSLKMISSTRADKSVRSLSSFILDADNTVTGSARTATVEIISSGTLNTDDVRLTLQYMGTSGSTIASKIESHATVLTAAAALPTSSVTWNSPPATPVKQYLQITFTPQTAGRVRGQVHLGKVSTTIWVNPQLTLA